MMIVVVTTMMKMQSKSFIKKTKMIVTRMMKSRFKTVLLYTQDLNLVTFSTSQKFSQEPLQKQTSDKSDTITLHNVIKGYQLSTYVTEKESCLKHET